MFQRCETQEDIKKLYRRLALRLHPDHGGDNELMMLLQEVYEVAEVIPTGMKSIFKILQKEKIEKEEKKKQEAEEQEKCRKKQEKTEKKEEKPQKKKKTFNGDYEFVDDDVYDGEPELDIIEEIRLYAKNHPKFKTDFVESIADYLDEHDFITSGQYNAMVRIYRSFHMAEEENS